MQPNAQGWCESYYGTWNVKDRKPKLGVSYFMLDEHIKKMVDREKEAFHKEMSKMVATFNKSVKEMIRKQSEEIKNIHASIGELSTFMFKIIDTNKLQTPEIEKKSKKKSKPKPKIEADEDDRGFGYL